MQNSKTYAALAIAAALGLAALATPASAHWYRGGVPYWGGYHGGWHTAWNRPLGYRHWGYGYGHGYGYGYGRGYGCGYGCGYGGYAAYTYTVPAVTYVPTYEMVPAVTGYNYGCGCGW